MEVTLEVIPNGWLDIERNREEYWQHGMSVSLSKQALKKEMESCSSTGSSHLCMIFMKSP